MTLLKRIVLLVIALPLVLAAIALVLVFTLDPNRLKPVITDAAAKQGITLAFKGDLAWQLYPNLGVTLGALTASTTDDQPLMEVGQASVSVALIPLLQRSIEVRGVTLTDAKAFYWVDEAGQDNWSSLAQSTGSSAAVSDTPAEASSGALPAFKINTIALQNLTLDYQDKSTGQSAKMRDIHLTITEFALNGSPFKVVLELTAKALDLPATEVKLQSSVTLNLDAKQLTLTHSTLDLSAGDAEAKLAFNTELSWGEAMQAKGSIQLAPTSIKPWLNTLQIALPPMQNPKALTQVGLSSQFQYIGENFDLSEIQITLDNTTLKGQVAVKHLSTPHIKSHWTGTTLQLDDYLPPPSDTPAPTAEPGEPTPLPLEALRALDLDAHIALEGIIAKGLVLDQPTLTVQAKDGLIQLSQFKTLLAEGEVTAHGQLDTRTDDAKLDLTLDSNGISVGTLLKAFADVDQLEGFVFADATVQSHGQTDQAMMDNLLVNAKVTSESLQVVPINLEKAYCQAVALLQKQTLPAFEWPKRTQLEPLTLNLQLRGPELNVAQLSAQIAKLSGNAEGTMNLDKGTFDFPFKLSIGDFAGDIEGCVTIPEKWRKRQLPIRCKGSLDDIGLKTCLPDTRLMEDMLKEKAKQKIEAEKDRAEQKLKDKAQELLDKNVKDEHKDAVKDLLKGFGR